MAPTSWRKKNWLLSGKYVATWEGMSRQAAVCRDIATDVATSSSMSRHRAVCRDIDDRCRDKQQYVATSTTSVATRNLCRDQKRCRSQKNRNLIFLTKFQAHFTLGPYIYTRFLGKEATGKIGEPLSWGFSL